MSRTRRKRDKKQRKEIKIRDWQAVNAWFRSGAGQMGDKRKEKSREECRKWKHDRRSED